MDTKEKKDLYVVIDYKKYQNIVMYNEAPYNLQEEIMSFEDAMYTADVTGAKVYKLVAVEEKIK